MYNLILYVLILFNYINYKTINYIFVENNCWVATILFNRQFNNSKIIKE